MCIKPGTYTDRALRKAVKGLLPQGGSPIAVLVFVSALTSLICWGQGTRGNEAKLETTLTKVMRTRRDGLPRCHCRCLPGAASLRSHQCLASPPFSCFHFQLRKNSAGNNNIVKGQHSHLTLTSNTFSSKFRLDSPAVTGCNVVTSKAQLTSDRTIG